MRYCVSIDLRLADNLSKMGNGYTRSESERKLPRCGLGRECGGVCENDGIEN